MLLYIGPLLGFALLILAHLRDAVDPEPVPVLMDDFMLEAIAELEAMFPEHPPIAFSRRLSYPGQHGACRRSLPARQVRSRARMS